jgi:hypothetical protein
MPANLFNDRWNPPPHALTKSIPFGEFLAAAGFSFSEYGDLQGLNNPEIIPYRTVNGQPLAANTAMLSGLEQSYRVD